MPREKLDTEGIPSTIMRSDKHAQATWKKTHDSAVETYGEDGEAAHRAAFASLKHSYKKVGDHWEPKARKGPSDPQARRGPNTRVKSTDPNTANTRGGAIAGMEQTKDELLQQARRLDVPGRSKMNKEELAVAVQSARR
jgi:hypothetical protein